MANEQHETCEVYSSVNRLVVLLLLSLFCCSGVFVIFVVVVW